MPPAPRQRRRLPHADGFTLVELLVVIAIISGLIAILLPSLNKARDSARRVRCASNLRSQGQLMHLYALDWEGKYPPGNGQAKQLDGKPVSVKWPFGELAWDVDGVPAGVPAGSIPGAQAVLVVEGYLDRPDELLFCPSLNPQLTYEKNWTYDPVANPVWDTSYTNYPYWATYAPVSNDWIVGPDEVLGTAAETAEAGGARPGDFWARDQTSGGDTVMMSELSTQLGPLAGRNTATDTRKTVDWALVNHADAAPEATNNRPAGGNLLLNDGSARWVPFSELKWRMHYNNQLSFYY